MKDDDNEAIHNFHVQICFDLCKALLESGKVYGFYFYTLNHE